MTPWGRISNRFGPILLLDQMKIPDPYTQPLRARKEVQEGLLDKGSIQEVEMALEVSDLSKEEMDIKEEGELIRDFGSYYLWMKLRELPAQCCRLHYFINNILKFPRSRPSQWSHRSRHQYDTGRNGMYAI